MGQSLQLNTGIRPCREACGAAKPICSHVYIDDEREPRNYPVGWDLQRGALPGLEVPVALASLLEPGAPLGPPVREGATAMHQAGSIPNEKDEGDAGHLWHVPEEVAVAASPRHLLASEEGSASRGLQEELMNVFLASMKEGVGLSMLFDCLGILVLEVRLLAAPSESLQLIFNGVRRCIPLCDVQEVHVQRAGRGSDSGAWLVDLELIKEGVCTFVFNGSEEGQRESHYFGGCLRALVYGARNRASEVARAAAKPPGLRPGSSVRSFRRELDGMQVSNAMQVKSKLTGDISSTGVENLEAEIAAELAKYD